MITSHTPSIKFLAKRLNILQPWKNFKNLNEQILHRQVPCHPSMQLHRAITEQGQTKGLGLLNIISLFNNLYILHPETAELKLFVRNIIWIKLFYDAELLTIKLQIICPNYRFLYQTVTGHLIMLSHDLVFVCKLHHFLYNIKYYVYIMKICQSPVELVRAVLNGRHWNVELIWVE